MSAAHVATPATGLRNHLLPSQTSTNYISQSWSDHMEFAPSNTENGQVSSFNAPTMQGENAQQIQDHRDKAIGGLLAQLKPNANQVEGENVTVETADVNNSVAIEEKENGDFRVSEEEVEGNISHPRLPSFAAADANDLLMNTDTMAITGEHHLPTSPSREEFPIQPFNVMEDSLPHSHSDPSTQTPVKRQYDAFARLEFADGIFYLNTYQCELGRDQHAYRNALVRDKEAKEAAANAQNQQHSSSGKASRRSDGVKQGESQVQGSVVSEAGGFAGVDGAPVEGYDPKHDGGAEPSHPSQLSESSGVHPAEVLRDPKLVPFDYGKNAVVQNAMLSNLENVSPLPEDEQPAPVLPEHMPDPQSCPLIPIHTTMGTDQSEVESLRAISRRHVKIFWSWKYSSFYLEVLGRNGAFVDSQWHGQGKSVPLHSGALIQISAVEFTFRLPISHEESIDDEDELEEAERAASSHLRPSVSPVDDDMMSPHPENGTQKSRLKSTSEAVSATRSGVATSDSKRRGPGRPPKNGFMSQREMKEVAKKRKEDEARAANGGKTPPPLIQRKLSKPQLPQPDQIQDSAKSEKRKYTKRKREGEEGEVVQSIETDEVNATAETPVEVTTTKRARSKSLSPVYPAKEDLSQEALARPQQNYAQLLYHILEDGPAPLKDIYRRMKMRWPFFVYHVESDGWQSSVRHNLNQEVGVLFRKGPKEGKGYHWERIEGAIDAYNANKTKRSTVTSQPQRPRPQPPRTQFPTSQGQQLTWQNTGPYPQQQGSGSTFVNQGQHLQQHQNSTQQGSRSSTNVNGQNGSLQAQAPNGIHRSTAARITQYDGPSSGGSGSDSDTSGLGHPTPSYIPCTWEGLDLLRRFEMNLMSQVERDSDEYAHFKVLFVSVKARLLHGMRQSNAPGGETEDERTLMRHLSSFIDEHRNPQFTGFLADHPNRVLEPSTSAVLPTPSLTQSSATPSNIPSTPPNQSLGTSPTVPATSANNGAVVVSGTNGASNGTANGTRNGTTNGGTNTDAENSVA